MPAEPTQLSLVDYLAVARSFAWVVNESVVTAARQANNARLIVATSKLSAVMTLLDGLLAEEELAKVQVTVGLPPGKDNALRRLYELILAQRGQGFVSIDESAISVTG